ncbi:MAG: ATP-binding protein [Candidatus Rokuibacteriota bacterium]
MGIPVDLWPILEDLNPWWREPGTRKALRWPVRRGVHQRLLDQLARLGDWRAQVLLGPRTVGKTTLLKQLADDLLDRRWPAQNLTYFDFEDDRLTREVRSEEIALLRPPGANPELPQVFLLDELRKVPRWDRWLKRAVDSQVGRIVATDSAASLLREESGQGRWDDIFLEGLTFREFGALNPGPRAPDAPPTARPLPGADAELLERYFALGGFPAHAASFDYPLVRERLRGDVVDRAIRKDLASRVEDAERVKRLFVYLVQQSGGEQNASDRAADLEVDPRTVSKWIDLLQGTLLIAALPRGTTSTKASARLRGRPKLYAADHGLVNAFAEAPTRDVDVRGRVFEAVVYRHLREVQRAREASLSYLRWNDGLEVDFLLEIGRERFAVEVTQSIQPKADKRKAVERAAARAGAGRAILIHGGLAEGEVEGVAFVPIGRFLVDPSMALSGGGG